MNEAMQLNSKNDIDDKFINKYCSDTLKAIDLMCEWILKF
jgi:hypothetical protein